MFRFLCEDEIDRCLKTVAERVEIFQDTFDKVNDDSLNFLDILTY